MAEKDLLIGKAALKNFWIDLKRMLDDSRSELNETACLGVVRDYMASSTVGHIMIARGKLLTNNETKNSKLEKTKW